MSFCNHFMFYTCLRITPARLCAEAVFPCRRAHFPVQEPSSLLGLPAEDTVKLCDVLSNATDPWRSRRTDDGCLLRGWVLSHSLEESPFVPREWGWVQSLNPGVPVRCPHGARCTSALCSTAAVTRGPSCSESIPVYPNAVLFSMVLV